MKKTFSVRNKQLSPSESFTWSVFLIEVSKLLSWPGRAVKYGSLSPLPLGQDKSLLSTQPLIIATFHLYHRILTKGGGLKFCIGIGPKMAWRSVSVLPSVTSSSHTSGPGGLKIAMYNIYMNGSKVTHQILIFCLETRDISFKDSELSQARLWNYNLY